MLIYQVDIEVHREIIEEFKNWLPVHVEEMLKIKGFISAHILTDITKQIAQDRPPDSLNLKENIRLSVQYQVESEASLQDYFLFHAERMRTPAVMQFGTKFRAQRRVLKIGLP